MAQHETHDVASGHQHQSNRTGPVDDSFGPAIDGGQFAHIAFNPAKSFCAVPATHQIQGDPGDENSGETDDEIGEQIDVGDRSEKIAIPGTEDQDPRRMLIDEGWSDVAADCAYYKQQRRQR